MFFGKPYLFFGDYLWNKFGCRVLKLPISAGFSCPNRDGTLSSLGCIFCSEEGSASPTALLSKDIFMQMENARSSFRRSDSQTKYIAYFQAFTNTYSGPVVLKKLYDEAISCPDVIGLMIGTRPDCLNDEILDLISQYRRDGFELWLEIGMQSSHDRSLKFLNRGHTQSATLDAVKRASERRIPVCLHVILGLPGETWSEIMETAEIISSLPVAGVKIHHLHVIRGTRLEELFTQGGIPLLSLKEYVSILCDFLERLRPEIIIHRVMGDRSEETLVAPAWGLHKGTVLKAIQDEFSRRGTFQGFLCSDPWGRM